jgi:hypothetical protein
MLVWKHTVDHTAGDYLDKNGLGGLRKRLSENGPFIAGSFARKFVVQDPSNFPVRDIDIWIPPTTGSTDDERLRKQRAEVVQLAAASSSTHGVPKLYSLKSLGGTYKRLATTIREIWVSTPYRENDLPLQLLIMKSMSTPAGLVETFDLTAAQAWYAGGTIGYKSCPGDRMRLNLTPSVLQQAHGEWVRTANRIVKYVRDKHFSFEHEQKDWEKIFRSDTFIRQSVEFVGDFVERWNSAVGAAPVGKDGQTGVPMIVLTENESGMVVANIYDSSSVYQLGGRPWIHPRGLARFGAQHASVKLFPAASNVKRFTHAKTRPVEVPRRSRCWEDATTREMESYLAADPGENLVVLDTRGRAHCFTRQKLQEVASHSIDRAQMWHQMPIKVDGKDMHVDSESIRRVLSDYNASYVDTEYVHPPRGHGGSRRLFTKLWVVHRVSVYATPLTQDSGATPASCFDYTEFDHTAVDDYLQEDTDENIVLLRPGGIPDGAVCYTRSRLLRGAVFYRCESESMARIDRSDPLVMISMNEFQAYVHASTLEAAARSRHRVFKLRDTGEVYQYTVSHAVLMDEEDHTSGHHCQAGTHTRDTVDSCNGDRNGRGNSRRCIQQ